MIVQGLLIEQIEQERDRIAEQQITIHQLKKEPNLGFYFTATDRDHWKLEIDHGDDWPYMMRCFYITPKLLLEISVFCQGSQWRELQNAALV